MGKNTTSKQVILVLLFIIIKYLPRFAVCGTTFSLLIYFHGSEPGQLCSDRSLLPSTGAFSPRHGSRTRSPAGSNNPYFCPFLASSPTFSLEFICSGRTFRDRPRLSAEIIRIFKHRHYSSRGLFQESNRCYSRLIKIRNPGCLLLLYLPAALFVHEESGV